MTLHEKKTQNKNFHVMEEPSISYTNIFPLVNHIADFYFAVIGSTSLTAPTQITSVPFTMQCQLMLYGLITYPLRSQQALFGSTQDIWLEATHRH